VFKEGNEMSQYRDLAKYLVSAEVEKREFVKITANLKLDLTVEEAYLVQQELVNIKLNEGKRIIGTKMGLTSHAKMKQMGMDEPIYGYVFDYMLIENGSQVPLQELIHPKVEAEIAFVIGEDIEGPGVTGAQVLAKTDMFSRHWKSSTAAMKILTLLYRMLSLIMLPRRELFSEQR
jgi:2-oxo-3-hexenedioate decarboxylase